MRCILSGISGFCLLTGAVQAQDIEPRAYSNAPVNINFLIAGYAYTDGGLAFDPSLPLTDPELETNSAVFAWARTLDVWGKSGKVDVILPVTWLSGSARYGEEVLTRDVDGLADARLRASVNLIGAPALSLQEFAAYQQDWIVGLSLQVSAPTGQYDPSRLVNIGTNRWSFKPEIGVSKALGRWTLEGAAAAFLYTDNDEFQENHTRAQDPLYSLQGHMIYSLKNGYWLSLDANYFTGGRTSIDGEHGNDRQKNWRTGITLAIPVDRLNSIKLNASSGVSARTGNDFDMFGIAWQHRWGGGL